MPKRLSRINHSTRSLMFTRSYHKARNSRAWRPERSHRRHGGVGTRGAGARRWFGAARWPERRADEDFCEGSFGQFLTYEEAITKERPTDCEDLGQYAVLKRPECLGTEEDDSWQRENSDDQRRHA